jgi:23S rRNA pseudouridine1911/1915/1917 synthase
MSGQDTPGAGAPEPAPSRRLRVEDDDAERLDVWLARQLPDLSRTRVAALLKAGAVRLNGRPARKSERPVRGDVVEVEIPPVEVSDIAPEPIPLHIVHEDADLLVIDKPAGLVVHPAPGHRGGTLVNALLHHVTDLSGVGGVARPGIVHRLDKDTSGLLLVAKHDRAHRLLSAALKRRTIRRRYLVACWGHLRQEAVQVDAPIGRSPVDRKRMAILATGRPAVTRFRRLERWTAADLLEAELETGRTHQIRVHLLSLGHPVVGDRAYGGGGARGMSGPGHGWARALARRVPRQFLHAAELAFGHPANGEHLHFRSELPADLAAAAAWARATSSPPDGS